MESYSEVTFASEDGGDLFEQMVSQVTARIQRIYLNIAMCDYVEVGWEDEFDLLCEQLRVILRAADDQCGITVRFVGNPEEPEPASGGGDLIDI